MKLALGTLTLRGGMAILGVAAFLILLAASAGCGGLTAPGLPANGFIYYTTDSTMPTHESKFVASGGMVTVSRSESLTAIAFAMGGCSDSAVAVARYEVVDASPAIDEPELDAATDATSKRLRLPSRT
jgi:hypothetical protein